MNPLFLCALILVIAGLIAAILGAVYFAWVFSLHEIDVNINPLRASELARITRTSLANVKKFSFTELEFATNMFHSSNEIGSGAFGVVYRGQLPDGSEIAVKRADNKTPTIDRDKSYQSELSSLCLTNHRNVVKLLGYCDENDERMLVFNYMEKGSLHACLHKNRGNTNRLDTWQIRNDVALGVAKGIAYLHECVCHPIIHGDIKPDNILLDSNWNASISDFGLARMFEASPSDGKTQAKGTRGYIDPEYHASGVSSPKSDVYAFGVVLLEIVTGKKAVFQDSAGYWTNIVDYVTDEIKSGNYEHIIDKTVRMATRKEEEAVERMLRMAVSCVDVGDKRPQMDEVIATLQRVSRELGPEV